MVRKFHANQELFVLKVIQEQKYGSIEEIAERMIHPPFDEYEALYPEEKLLRLIVKRWEKGKAITSDVFQGERRYFVRDLPWLAQLQMIHFVSVSSEKAQALRDELLLKCRKLSARRQREPDITRYLMVEATFETVTPILGGDLSEKDRELIFPRNYDGMLYIRPNWLHGYFRDNARLLALPGTMAKYLSPSEGIFTEQPKLFTTQRIRVKEGHDVYEAIPPKTQFKTTLHLPLKGYDKFDSLEKWVEAIKHINRFSLRGLGANAKVFGGKIKLVGIKEIS